MVKVIVIIAAVIALVSFGLTTYFARQRTEESRRKMLTFVWVGVACALVVSGVSLLT